MVRAWQRVGVWWGWWAACALGAGCEPSSAPWPEVDAWIEAPGPLAVDDIDGDGRLDLQVAPGRWIEAFVLAAAVPLTLADAVDGPERVGAPTPALRADLDGDGLDDPVLELLGGLPALAPFRGATPAPMEVVCVGDLQPDGADDVVVRWEGLPQAALVLGRRRPAAMSRAASAAAQAAPGPPGAPREAQAHPVGSTSLSVRPSGHTAGSASGT